MIAGLLAPGRSLRVVWICVLWIGVTAEGAGQLCVRQFWSGALESTSIRVNVLVDSTCDSLRLVIDDNPTWASSTYSEYVTIDTSQGGMVHLLATELVPGTPYRYRFEVNGTIDTSAAHIGSFRTPSAGAFSYSFVAGSCNSDGDHPVWNSMGWSQPLFFLCSGDLHYADPNSLDLNVHRNAYVDHVYAKATLMNFTHHTPIAYVWDDHDFSGNGAYGNAIGKPNAARAYREHVPHYALPHDTAVYQAFTIGRVHFILSDMRATKDSTAMMSSEQRDWLHTQLLLAKDSGLVSCWVTSLSWNSYGWPENWGSQPAERTALGDWLMTNSIRNLFIISGDAHMLAIDDGANCDFSTLQNSPYRYPILQAAAINRAGSYKGGTFNQGGYFINPSAVYGQFGQVLVNDDGADVCITFNGWRTDSMSATISLMNTYTFCRTPVIHQVAQVPTEDLRVWYSLEGELHIDGPSTSDQFDMRVLDVSGREVAYGRSTEPGLTRSVKLPELSSGIYMAELAFSDHRTVVKFAVP